jgi:hypothetical protein
MSHFGIVVLSPGFLRKLGPTRAIPGRTSELPEPVGAQRKALPIEVFEKLFHNPNIGVENNIKGSPSAATHLLLVWHSDHDRMHSIG